MGVHELDQVLATAAVAVAAHTTTVDVAPPAACSSGHEAQALAKRLTAAPPTYSRLSTSDHRRKDAQCIRYASGGSVATRTCVGLQRGLPGRRRAWQVQVALNRC